MQLVLLGQIKDVENREVYDKKSKTTDKFVEVFIKQESKTEEEMATITLSLEFKNELEMAIGKYIVIPFIHSVTWLSILEEEVSILMMNKEKYFSIYPENPLTSIPSSDNNGGKYAK